MDVTRLRRRTFCVRRGAMRLTRHLLLVLFVCAVVAVPVALAAVSGTYKGKIKGNTDVTVKVKNNRVTKFTTSIYASCGLSNFIITVAYPPAGQKGEVGEDQERQVQGRVQGLAGRRG